MRRHRTRKAVAGVISMAAVAALCACASSPAPRLYTLSSDAAAPAPASRPHRAVRVLVSSVTVPEYLDRPEIVTRVSEHRLVAADEARWAEPLATSATRALTRSLANRLPDHTVVMEDSRDRQAEGDYQVRLELDAFEADPSGRAILAGRWRILESRSGAERSARQVALAEATGGRGFDGIAAAMSRDLDEVAGEIGAALSQVTMRPAGSKR